ncbi:transcription factor B2 [Willisornis vidua]|uniref:Dimethyladenosine transferase 2, mitochondrial n=1 Tax=Willisornis vidua TaxID=1566151 RepID=A0ABQ9DBA8_9PASS|nr:transcription factor B2 [Willisornis vidua]
MLAGRAPPGAAGRGRLLAEALRPLLRGLWPCWAAGPQCRGLRAAEAAEEAPAERLVQREKRSGVAVRRFIACPRLARTVQQCLQRGAGPGPQPVLLEFSPGPGILTQTLLDAGLRVVALESNLAYLPNLQVVFEHVFCLGGMFCETSYCIQISSTEADFIQSLENSLDGQLKVIYGDFFRLDPLVLTGKPGRAWAYQALTVLAQIGCEIELLHMEPWSSFATNMKSGGLAIPKSKRLPNDHLCLVRLTPQQNLFTRGLKPTNAATFIFMVKQCLAKPKSRLRDRLNSWSLDNTSKLLKELEIPKNAIVRDLYPEDYRRLFEALQNSSTFAETWFCEDVMESVRTINL